MQRALRSMSSMTLASAFLVVLAMPATAGTQSTDNTISASEPSSFEIPGGGTVVFNPTDPNAVGASVDVAPLNVAGATAQTPGGDVVAIGDGVEVTVTSPAGDSVTSIEHAVTITPGSADGPAVADLTPAIELTFPVAEADIAGIDRATLGVYSRETADEPWVWVPSAYDAERGAVVAQSDHLSEFTVMGAPVEQDSTSNGRAPRIALDPDDLVGRALWNGQVYNELQFSYAVATEVQARLQAECSAEVLITRTADDAVVSRTTRANLIKNFDADIAMTLAFNTYNSSPTDGIARPWGIEQDGGVIAWAANNSASTMLGNSIKADIAAYTGRSDRRPLNPSGTNLPYSQLVASAPAYAHAELLFLDHNYDWPVISTRRDLVVDAVFASIVDQIAATSGISCAEPVTLPEPPSQAVIDQLRQLGRNNYQMYGTDPVNLSTGNFVSSEKVFTLTGVGDQEMDLSLAYNALDGREGPVGKGWNFAFVSRAQLFADGSYLVTLADGRRVGFVPDGGGGFTVTSGGQASLSEIDSGVRMTFGDGTSLDFAVDEDSGYGTLVRTVDRQGNAFTLTYGPMAEVAEGHVAFPPLQSITDEAGQVVVVTSTESGLITGFTHPDGRQWLLTHDAEGNLTSVTDGAGRVRSFTYNAEGLLSVVTGADGVKEVTNAYDDQNRVVTQTDGAGNVRTIAYSADRSTILTDALGYESVIDHNALGQSVATHDAEGGVTRTEYDANGNPTASIDANGHLFESTFDEYGRVLTTTSPLGGVTSYTYNSLGDLTSISTPGANGETATTSFVLNSDGRAIETHLPDGSVTYATYDAHGDVTSITDALGHVTSFDYDSRGNTTTVTNPLGNATHHTYDLANRLTSTTDALGNVTTTVWDEADNIMSTTDAEGNVTAYTYDVNGSLLSQTDALGRVSAYEYNVNMQRTAVINPDGSRVSFEYDAEHHLTKQTNPDGTSRMWEYDGLGRATAMVDEAGQRWVTEYDAIGNAVATVDPNGHRTTRTYDSLGHVTSITDPLGNTTSLTYNPAGLLTATTDPLGRATSFEYDAAGREIRVTNPDASATATEWNANGQQVATTDPRGYTTMYEYDAAGRLAAVVDPLGGRTESEYDAVGNLVTRTDALDHRTDYSYDRVGRLITTTNAMGDTVTTTCDEVGNIVGVTDVLGGVTTYAYDAMDRLVASTSPDGATTAYDYNSVGDLESVTNALGATVAFEYDATRRRTALVDEAGQRWESAYDAVGNVVASVDPRGARTTTAYDAADRPVTVTDALGHTASARYDAAGQVVAIEDALGRVSTFAYDAMGRMTATTYPDGSVVGVEYDQAGNVIARTDERGFVTRFEYDALGREVTITDALGQRSIREYDAVGNVIAAVDESGARTTHAYDVLSRLVTTTDALGGVSTVSYDAAGNVVATIDVAGHETVAEFDAMSRPVRMTAADGGVTAFAYDNLGQLVRQTDPLGNVTTHEWDSCGLEVATVDPVGGRWVTEYDAAGNPTATIDPLGAREAVTYDLLGRPTSSINALGAVTTRTFDAVGNIVGVTDAVGNVTTYTYDVRDRMLSVTSPEGAVTSFAYDAAGNATSATDAIGNTFYTEYDPLGRAVAQVDPMGGRTETRYDAVGRVLSVTDPRGNATASEYDALGRLITSTDAAGFTTAREYDAVGNLLSETDPKGGVTQSTYDEAGRPLTVTDATGATTSTEYDAAGRVVGVTNPLGVVTRYDYDPRGLLVTTTENAVAGVAPSGTANVTTSVTYDARGLVTAITDPRGMVTTYTRDAAGQLVGQTNPLGHTIVTAYDALGRPTAVTAADGSVTSTSYTPDGWTSEIAYPGETVTSTYDALGRRTSMTDRLGTSTWAYDWAGRVTSETDARGHTHTHGYDAVGNEVSTGYSDGRTVTREFDGRGLVSSQTDLTGTSRYTYDATGLVVGIQRPSGVITGFERDAAGRVTSIRHAGKDDHPTWPSPHVKEPPSSWWSQWWHRPASSSELSIAYTYDARGLVVERDFRSAGGNYVTTYTHDALGRLTGSASPVDVVSYEWDAASNLVSESHTNNPTTPKPRDGYEIVRDVNDANQLVSLVRTETGPGRGAVEVTDYAYDLRGNRIKEVTWDGLHPKGRVLDQTVYGYDGRDDVVLVSGALSPGQGKGQAASTSFMRDGLGRALTVVEGGEISARLFAGLEVVAEGATQVVRDPFGAVQSEVTTTWRGGGRGANAETSEHDVLTDVLGSPVSIAVDGVISADVQAFSDFGDVLNAPQWSTVVSFTGQVSTAGLVEFASRTFDPVSRVWLERDAFAGSVTRASSLNRYAYVEGAPESFVDRWGFFRAAAALQAQRLASLQVSFDEALSKLNGLLGDAAFMGQGLSASQMMAQYNRLYASSDPVVRAALSKVAQDAFYGVSAARYQGERELIREAKRVAAFRASVAAENARDTAIRQANAQIAATQAAAREADRSVWDRAVGVLSSVVTAQVGDSKCSSLAGAAYFAYSGGVNCQWEQYQYNQFDPLEQLDVAWHGVVNFGSGVVNGASSLANGITAAVNWGNNACAGVSVCVDIPEVPAIPQIGVWGDADLYGGSQLSGQVTFGAVSAVATAGAGSAARGVSFASVKASTALVEASGWNLVKSTISWGKTAVPALVGTVKTGAAGAFERVGGVIEAVKTGGSSAKAWLGGVIDDASNTLRKFYLADDTGAVSFGGKADEAANSAEGLPRNALGQFTAGAGGESAATAAGRSAHASYPNTLGWSSADDVAFNQAMRGTNLRPDAVNYTQRIVRELKPDSPRSIADGWRQVNRYKAYLEELTGESWTAYVDVYTP